MKKVLQWDSCKKQLPMILFVLVMLIGNIQILMSIKNMPDKQYNLYRQDDYVGIEEGRKYPVDIYCDNPKEFIVSLKNAEALIENVSYVLEDENGKTLYEYEAKVGDGLERVDETTADLHVPLRGEYVHGRKLFLLFRNNMMGTAIYGNAEKGIWHIEIYTPDKSWYYVCILCIDVILSLGMYGLLKNGLSTKAYIISSLVMGILLALILPPDSQDDEFRHLVRAYDISQGHIITHQIDSKENMKGNAIGELYGHFPYAEIPAEMDAQRMTDQSINYDNTSYQAEINLSASRERMQTILAEDEEQGTKMVAQTGTWAVTVLSYWPQVLGIWFARLCHVRAFFFCYFARIANMLVCTLIGYAALKLLPEYQLGIWAFQLMPGFLILKSSNSTDGLLISLCILFVVYLVSLKRNEQVWYNWKRVLFLIGLSTYIALMKLPYILLLGVILVFTNENYRQKKGSFLKSCGFAGGMFVVSYILYTRFRGFFIRMTMNQVPIGQRSSMESSTMLEDIMWLMQNRRVFVKYLLSQIGPTVDNVIQAINGKLYPLGIAYILIVLVMMLAMKKYVNWDRKLWMFLLFIGTWISIIWVFFAVDDAGVGYNWGVSPRYMLPLLPLGFVLLPIGNERSTKVAENMYYILYFTSIVQVLYGMYYYWIA